MRSMAWMSIGRIIGSLKTYWERAIICSGLWKTVGVYFHWILCIFRLKASEPILINAQGALVRLPRETGAGQGFPEWQRTASVCQAHCREKGTSVQARAGQCREDIWSARSSCCCRVDGVCEVCLISHATGPMKLVSVNLSAET